jgi:hypothetical protein
MQTMQKNQVEEKGLQTVRKENNEQCDKHICKIAGAEMLNRWLDHDKPEFIEETVRQVCDNIAYRGEKTLYKEIFEMIYEHIEDNLNDFFPEVASEY